MYAAVIAGGMGTRFWPLSRKNRPKQLLSILGPRTMIQMTVDRLHGLIGIDETLVVADAQSGPRIREQIPEMPKENIIEEPVGRGTAAAVGLAAKVVKERSPGASLAVLPSDHLITGEKFFRAQVQAAGRAARENDFLVTFGIRPTRPETGYGYIEALEDVACEENGFRFHRVARFHEKPDVRTAKKYVQDGSFYWNSGIFVFSAGLILKKIETLLPKLHKGLMGVKGGPGEKAFAESLASAYKDLPATSIDHGVMEHSKKVVTIPADFGWSDLGSWESLFEASERNEKGHCIEGEVLDVNSANCLVKGGNRLIALVGVEGLAVVDTDDALLICRLDVSQEVREVVKRLTDEGKTKLL